LDGGHLLYSLVGERARILYYPILAGLVILVLSGGEVWLLWVVMLFILGRVYAVPLDMITPLDNRRKIIAAVGLAMFVLTFVPIPFSTATDAPARIPQSTIWLPAMMITLYTLWRRH
jgi:membrane-associated protease RseP (regulator of RpoE activity)